MFHKYDKEEEVVIIMTLNGPITVNIIKTNNGQFKLSINAPKDVTIYRENMSVAG